MRRLSVVATRVALLAVAPLVLFVLWLTTGAAALSTLATSASTDFPPTRPRTARAAACGRLAWSAGTKPRPGPVIDRQDGAVRDRLIAATVTAAAALGAFTALTIAVARRPINRTI